MKLIKQRKLYFKEGRSDKVYEVDLCQADEDEFVVNFRYGRSGQTLREGTKTAFPVSLERAEKIYVRLVESKVSKGYQNSGESEDTGIETAKSQQLQMQAENPELRSKLIDYLTSAADGTYPETWQLSRIIWRAGELRISEALPALITLTTSPACDDPMSRYSLAWAIGRCGVNDLAAAKALRQMVAGVNVDDATRRMGAEALRIVDPASVSEITGELPHRIRAALGGEGGMVELRSAVQQEIDSTEPPHDFLQQLYQLADVHPHAREVVFEIAQSVPLRPPFFKHIRYLFKAAEFRLDAEFFGMLARRFETSNPFYSSNSWGGDHVWVEALGKSIRVSEESTKPGSRLAYSSRTRNYLRRRVVAVLKRAGAANDVEAFITLATGVLLAYRDDRDRKEPTRKVNYALGWNAFEQFDEFGDYHAFNFLLYRNSERYQPKKNLRWCCQGGYEPGQLAVLTGLQKRASNYASVLDSVLPVILGCGEVDNSPEN
ncbi:MAG: putative DNA-binding WGR domain protein [Verrucomicrobiales bacterium]|jgi:predicted DNA-binding WGR domain protein